MSKPVCHQFVGASAGSQPPDTGRNQGPGRGSPSTARRSGRNILSSQLGIIQPVSLQPVCVTVLPASHNEPFRPPLPRRPSLSCRQHRHLVGEPSAALNLARVLVVFLLRQRRRISLLDRFSRASFCFRLFLSGSLFRRTIFFVSRQSRPLRLCRFLPVSALACFHTLTASSTSCHDSYRLLRCPLNFLSIY